VLDFYDGMAVLRAIGEASVVPLSLSREWLSTRTAWCDLLEVLLSDQAGPK
jgi:hypothetical protein